MYEKISDRLLSTEHFLLRILKHVLYVIILLAFSLLFGTLGFMVFEGYGLEEALIHALHILSGFGLLALPTSFSGRVFASLFGLYASLFFLAAFSFMFAPVLHRILHKLHLEEDRQD